MSGIKRRKCHHWRELFIADARNATRQRYCSKPQCRKASKAAEIMGMGKEAYLALSDAMRVEFSYLEESDVSTEVKWR